MDDRETFAPHHLPPRPRRPLLGITVLVIEDSRFACEALRLMCLRSGARIRRADCLSSARRHLQVYRPSAMVVDIGLPDGSGLDLIGELDSATPRVGAILATSGDDGLREAALAAGADGFLAKPLHSLLAFQQALLAALPADRQPCGPVPLREQQIEPDAAAFHDDMRHAATLLDDHREGPVIDYLTGFLRGVARSAGDETLLTVTDTLAASRAGGRTPPAQVDRLAGLVETRLQARAAI